MKPIPLLLPLLCLASLKGQDSGIEQPSAYTTAPTGESIFLWNGKAGRSYFIQISDPADHLGKWNWAPAIESGNDEEISYEVDATADKGFFRLKYTDQLLDSGKTIETSDFDKDGISNIDEIDPPTSTVGGPTDPLNSDTDGDGLNDGFERTHGYNPNNSDENDNGIPDGQDDNDGDGLTNAEEQALGTNPDNADTDGDGISDKDETTNGTNPSSDDTDGDLAKDGHDADPNEPLVAWEPAPESSYVLIEVDAPAGAGYAQDLNDKGEVLFDNGIWAGGDWIPKSFPEITGVFPDSVSTGFPDGIPYKVVPGQWSCFNDDRKLLQVARIQPTDGPGVDGSAPCPVFWPAGQSSPSLIFNTADRWAPNMWHADPLGVSAAGEMAVRVHTNNPWEESGVPAEHIERYDASGALAGVMDGAEGYHPTTDYSIGTMSRAGWVVSNLYRTATSTLSGGYKLGLWNASNTLISLPAEAAGTAYPTHVTDLPNGKVGVVAGQASSTSVTSRVFLPDASGDYQYVQSMSNQHLQLMAGDGTAMSDDGKLWRNGKLIPLRKLCEKFKTLEDTEYSFHPLKANKNGTYLVQAQNATGDTKTFLTTPITVDGVDTTVNPANVEAPDRGVDNISIRAENKPNNGYQSDTWIMAPISRTSIVRFRSAANPSLPLHLSAENATFTPAVLDSPDQQVTVTGTGTATSEFSLIVKMGTQEIPNPIKVMAMKRRTVKVAVHAVGLNVVPPEIPTVPAPGVIQNYLNSVFSTQINADIVVVPGPNEVPLSWDIGRASEYELSGPGSEGLHEGNGTFDFTDADGLEQEDKYINLTLRDTNVDINVYVLTRHLLGWYDRQPGAGIITGAVGMTRRTPSVILIDGKQSEFVTTIAHEIGHCMIDYGHPNSDPFLAALSKLTGKKEKRGPAPHDGLGAEEWKKRLMYSTSLPTAGKTMVKSEWDATETWLKNRPRGDN